MRVIQKFTPDGELEEELDEFCDEYEWDRVFLVGEENRITRKMYGTVVETGPSTVSISTQDSVWEHNIYPDEARELAKILLSAADIVEMRMKREMEENDA